MVKPILIIRGVGENDSTQDVVGVLTLTPQGAKEVLNDIEEWLGELEDDY